MKEAGLTISGMAILSCWALLLLLLTTFPLLALGGRRDPRATGLQSLSEGQPEASANRFAEIIHGVASEPENKIRYPHQLQQNGIRGGPTLRVWKDKKQPSYTHEHLHLHRLLIGSSPPTCRGKCGICQPCKPVHVIIAASRVAIAEQEYYPEVWRCQCGNMLYMP